MVSSASLAIADKTIGNPYHYLIRQSIFLVIGFLSAFLVTRISISSWRNLDSIILFFVFIQLIFVLIPGIGHQVNGSYRWLQIGPIGFQVSELAKLSLIIFTAGYISRHYGDQLKTFSGGIMRPMLVVSIFAILLLAEPDFGATVVITATILAMLFLAEVRFLHFILILVGAILCLGALILLAPYRFERLIAFTSPWADQFNSGYQLTQALIAIGRGSWFGVGLGESIQKLFYLPEAHTDFMFAVIGEELGFLGLLFVIILFLAIILTGLKIGRKAHHMQMHFEAFLSYGISLWFGLQAFVSIGVNIGSLPTKGITLPLMSSGGSSLVITCISLALLVRVAIECNENLQKESF